MSDTEGFTIWLSGGAARVAGAFASELRARLTRRGLRVWMWPPEELDEPGEKPSGAVNIVLDEGLARATHERLQGTLPRPVRVVLGHTGESDTPEEPQHEPGVAALQKLAFEVSEESLNDDVSRLLSLLESRGLISGTDADTRRDEQLLIERLTELGYL